MNNFINQQNKLHFALFKHYDELMKRSHRLSSHTICFNKYFEMLNKRVSQLSPRRGKKQALKLANDLLRGSKGHSLEELNEVAAIVEDDT